MPRPSADASLILQAKNALSTCKYQVELVCADKNEGQELIEIWSVAALRTDSAV